MPGTDFTIHAYQPVLQAPVPAAPAATSDGLSFGFDDLLDIVNPLQHIPVISTLYRHLTGDKIGTPEKIAGDTLYGGLTGLISSVGDAIFTEVTGKSVGDTVYDYVFGDDTAPPTGVAANDNSPPAQTASKSFGNTVYAYLFGDDTAPPTGVAANDNSPPTQTSSKSFGDTVYAYLFGDDTAPQTGVAANEIPAPTQPTGNATAQQASAAYRSSGRLLEAY